MKAEEALAWAESLAPSGDSGADEIALYDVLENLPAQSRSPELEHALIAIFERFPEAELGSPGPIVDYLEEAPDAELIPLISESLKRRATIMVIWMAERCFRSDLDPSHHAQLVDALRTAETADDEEVVDGIAEALELYESG